MAKIKAGKTSQVFSDNPKMGTPYVRGYKDGADIETYFSGRGLREILKEQRTPEQQAIKVEIERGPYRIDPDDKRTLKEIAQRSTLGDPEDRERAKQDKGRYTKMQVKDD